MTLIVAATNIQECQSRISDSPYVPALAAVASGLLLAIPYLFPAAFILMWLAWVPLLLVIQQHKASIVYALGLVTGLTFYFVSGYWIVDFTILFKGYSLLGSTVGSSLIWLYSAQLPALLVLSYSVLQRRFKLPPALLFPILTVLFFTHFPLLFPVHLGGSQSQFLIALQAIEFTGVYGLDWLIALVNMCLTLSISRHPHRFISLTASTLIVGVWLGYGYYANTYWQAQIQQWQPRSIGIVQPNETPTLTPTTVYSGFSKTYPPEMAMTELLAKAGATIVVWPEAKPKSFFNTPYVAAAYRSNIKQLGITLVLQDMELATAPSLRATSSTLQRRHYNAAAAINTSGELAGHYRKIKRIPFGEMLPIIDQWPWLGITTRQYLGDFFKDIKAGNHQQVFKLDDLDIIPVICYESLFPQFVANAARNSQRSALITILSNDGWFGKTIQPQQHLNVSILRAVENRLPLVHAINNGPSAAVLPNGKVVAKTDFDTAGGYLVELAVNNHKQATLFNRAPGLFISCIWLAFGGLLLSSYWRRRTTST